MVGTSSEHGRDMVGTPPLLPRRQAGFGPARTGNKKTCRVTTGLY